MSRRTAAAGPTISLFPFLAVLLCMMGALLVLLVLFSRSASVAGQGAGGAATEELELALENARWRRECLDEARRKTEADLSRARMALAAVEENTRALEDEIDRLAREAEALEARATAAADDELAGLEARLRDARESLDEARADLASRPPAYAVVPYVGKQGTHRRPLYIECAVDGVYLQPEGIRLQPGDFDGPPGPGNPLASALRAAREHMARTSPNPADPAAQPYPLLLVRPSGVMAYYAAREAIVSWGSEFGYQFIDDDWQIAYPPPDPGLAEAETRAVEEARRRLQWLAENHPQRPPRPARQYRAAPTRGGVVANDGPSLLGDQAQFEWTGGDGAAGAAARGSGGPGGRLGGGGLAAGSGTGPGAGSGGSGGPGSGAASGDGAVGPGRPFLAAAGTADDPAGDAILGRSGGSGRAGGSPGGVVAAGGAPGNGPPGTPGQGAATAPGEPGGGNAFGQPGLVAAPGAAPGGPDSGGGADGGGADGGGDPSGGGSTGADRYAAAGGSSFTSAPRGGAPGASGGASGGASAGAAGSGNLALGAGNDASGGAGGEVSMPGLVGAPGAGGGGMTGGGAAGSIASARGANWASLATRDRPVPLTRPIHVECALDEFRLLDDTGRRVERRVPIAGDTALAIDPFVGALHARVRGWGIAGERMYWRPELVLSATVDGESRRDDLERLLADSGIDVRPRAGAEEVKALPPVQRASYERPVR